MSETLTLILVATGVIGACYGAWRRFQPKVRRAGAAIDALVGKEPVMDRSGQIMEAAQPGLVHRVATVEEAVVEIRHVVALWSDTQRRLDQHDGRLKTLEDARLERMVNQYESGQMLRAVAEHAASEADQT